VLHVISEIIIYSRVLLLAAWTCVPACYHRDKERAREKEALPRSGQEKQRHHKIHGADGRYYREEPAILETLYFLVNSLDLYCVLPRLPPPFFAEQRIPREVYPLREGLRNQVRCHFHCKFVYDPGWPYFFFKTNTHTHTFPSDLLHILSTRL